MASVRALEPGDVASVARIHELAFPDYFLTQLGPHVLRRYYAEFAGKSGNYGVVGCIDGEVVGFVVGTASSARMYDAFYRSNTLRLLPVVALRLFTCPGLARRLLQRSAHVFQSLGALVRRLTARAAPAARPVGPSAVTARLLSIGLHPSRRGQGLAGAMVDHFCALMSRDGIPQVGLSVFADNNRAISFYSRTGWQLEKTTGHGLYFVRATSPIISEARAD